MQKISFWVDRGKVFQKSRYQETVKTYILQYQLKQSEIIFLILF